MADGLCLRLVDDQLPVLHVVAQGRVAAHPQALFLGGGDLVANTLAGDLADIDDLTDGDVQRLLRQLHALGVINDAAEEDGPEQ